VGEFTIPGRTTAVFIEYAPPQERIGHLIEAVQELHSQAVLNRGQTNSLVSKLENAVRSLNAGRPGPAVNQLNAFIHELRSLLAQGRLSQSQAQPLIEAAKDIIWQIENGA
jgi:ABC-type transporter Mla subunit MlaD